MPSRVEVANELADQQQKGQRIAREAIDDVRRKYLKELADYTKRDTVIFATNQHPIIPDDIRGFMVAFHELKNESLDLIIMSGGGSSEAIEQIVAYCRKKYKHIRALIPDRAMSAATMLACAANEIIMGKHSALGPIDPQFTMANCPMSAHAILEDFNKALTDIKNDPKTAALWVPRLHPLPHGIISYCEQTIKRSEELVGKWLTEFGRIDAQKSQEIAKWLASKDHKSHGKPIDAESALSYGMPIIKLEDDQVLQDKLLSVFHAIALTFEQNPCFKITENQDGKGHYLVQAQMVIPQIVQPGIVPPQPQAIQSSMAS